MIRTRFFFRKPSPAYHSIEELFDNIIRHLPDNIKAHVHQAKYSGIGVFKILFNSLEAPFYQKDVNHITGDVHYIACLLRKKKTILTIHDLEIIKRSNGFKKSLLLFFWFKLPAYRVKYITVISEFTRSELLKYVRIAPGKIKVIPNCIPGSIPFSPKQFNTDCPLILQVGTKNNKNIPNLIKALEGIACKLIILGKIQDEQKKLLDKYNIQYENLQGLSYDKVIELYKQIDLLAFVSTYEGFGLPILEAQSVGRPVLTGNISSMPEVANEGALYIDPHSVQAIREGILKIINDASCREELIKKGLENVKKFQPEIIAAQYAALYAEVYNEYKERAWYKRLV